MPRLKQEPLSSCAFVTYASIKVASHSGPEMQWLSRTDLIGTTLHSFLSLLFPFGIPCILLYLIIFQICAAMHFQCRHRAQI